MVFYRLDSVLNYFSVSTNVIVSVLDAFVVLDTLPNSRESEKKKKKRSLVR